MLIADDDDHIRELVVATFDPDYRMIEAADGDEAWRLMLDQRPDVALLDINMPGLGGLELAEAIGGEPALDGTRVVMLTGVDPMDLEYHLPNSGQHPRINLFVQKPFTPSSLRSSLKSLD